MILAVIATNSSRGRGAIRHAEDEAACQVLVDELLGTYGQSDEVQKERRAELFFGTEPISAPDYEPFPDNYLLVCLNGETGFGGLVWSAMRERAELGGVNEYVWISNNPNPPEADPRVASDPWVPYFLDRRSVLSIEVMRRVLLEYCRRGTGDRPEGIDWVPGEMNGLRHDSEEFAALMRERGE